MMALPLHACGQAVPLSWYVRRRAQRRRAEKESAVGSTGLRDGSRGQGQGHQRAPQELAEDIKSRKPLLPAGPPHRHQDRAPFLLAVRSPSHVARQAW